MRGGEEVAGKVKDTGKMQEPKLIQGADTASCVRIKPAFRLRRAGWQGRWWVLGSGTGLQGCNVCRLLAAVRWDVALACQLAS